MNLPNIATRVFHTPLMITPAKAAAAVSALGPRILGSGQIEFSQEFSADEGVNKPREFASVLDRRLTHEIQSGRRDAYTIRDGIAVIPIVGTLIHRGAWLGSFSGETSYEGVAAQIEAATEDYRVKAIALEEGSYGGEVSGCFSLAKSIRKAREKKPVWAFIADHAYSAAYALASQASRIIVPRAGGVGSIGVICLHADHSAQLESVGVNVSVISAGEHKGEGNPYEPLPEAVRESMQQEMESLREIFAETVAEGRGSKMSKQQVLDTEAACYLGADAVTAGLADEVGDPAEAFEQFVSEINGRAHSGGPTATHQRSETVTTETEDTPEVEAIDEAPKTEATEAAPETEPATTAAPEASTENAAANENARIMGILNCDEAKGRDALAKSLAGDVNMTVEQAKKHLAAAPVEQAGKTLSQEMADDDASLDSPAPSAEVKNPVLEANKRRHQQ